MENLSDDFNRVVDLCQKKLNTDEIFEFLKTGSVIEKQVAVLELEEIRSEVDAEILLNNLVGIDGKVRQAVAFKLLQLMKKYFSFFLNPKFYQTFVNAIIDIDSNVCRMVLDSVLYLKKDRGFCVFMANAFENTINIAFEELSKLSFKTKKYTSNKQYFKIYWALEALEQFYSFIEFDRLKNLLEKCAILPEYTIREKCAIILKNDFNDESLNVLRKNLSNDENYYVRNVLQSC